MPSRLLVAARLYEQHCFLCHPTLNERPDLCLRHYVLFTLRLLRFQVRSGQFGRRWKP